MTGRRFAVALTLALLVLFLLPGAEARKKKKKPAQPSSTSRVDGKTSSSRNSTKGGRKKSGKRRGKKSSGETRETRAPRLSAAGLLDSLAPVDVEGASALGPFFEALALPTGDPGPPDPDARRVRVLHFGDSHVAADYWTGELRTLLQARFGDGGPGFVMPGRPWKYFRHSAAKSYGGSRGWTRCGLRGDPCQGLVGVARVGLRPAPAGRRGQEPAGLEATFRFCEVAWAVSGPEARPKTTLDGRPFLPPDATVEAGPPLPAMGEKAGEEPAGPEPWLTTQNLEPLGPADWTLLTETLAEPAAPCPHRLEMEAGGEAILLGADLRSGRPGVVVDTLGINGSELQDLECWWEGVLPALMRHADPALVIVSFGTNDMGGKAFDAAEYGRACSRVLGALRAAAPSAAVLVTGPMDRGGRGRKSRATMQERSAAITGAMRTAALAAGCAFWDGRAAMGGGGAMPRWAAARLAQRDQVHLTESGYQHFGRFLVDALIRAYEGWDAAKLPGPAPASFSP